MIFYTGATFTPEGYADALRRWGAGLRPSIARELRRQAPLLRDAYIERAKRRGIVRSIFGKRDKGLLGLIKTRVKDEGSSFRLMLEIRGLPALQEAGGRTRAPRKGAIYPSTRKALKLMIPSSRGVVIVASAKHRGARIARFPVVNQTFAHRAPQILAGLDKAICTFRAANGVQIATPGAA